MATTKLSSKGQELEVIDMGDGVLLKPRAPFEGTSLDQVASSLKYSGNAKSLKDIICQPIRSEPARKI